MDDENLNLSRLRRISDFWNWLPAYRAVAETEHVRTAAERLRVSPSALSRSVGLLEENIGELLFDREGRGIKLNRAGREFLTNLRVAMRLIDEALQSVESASFIGTLHLAVPDDVARLLWPGLRALREEHPNLVVRLQSSPARDVNDRLTKGALDIAFQQRPAPAPDLVVEQFTETTNGVYCGVEHPLYGRDDVDEEDLVKSAFVAGVDADGTPADGWPPDRDREVAIYVHRLQAAVEACAFGGFLAALPDHVAEPYCERELLWKIPVDIVPGSVFYLTRRKSVTETDRNAIIASFLKDHL